MKEEDRNNILELIVYKVNNEIMNNENDQENNETLIDAYFKKMEAFITKWRDRKCEKIGKKPLIENCAGYQIRNHIMHKGMNIHVEYLWIPLLKSVHQYFRFVSDKWGDEVNNYSSDDVYKMLQNFVCHFCVIHSYVIYTLSYTYSW